MNYIQDIFLKIANRMGLQLEEKKTNNYDYTVTDDISLTACISNRLSTLTMLDSTVEVLGNNKRAFYIGELIDEFVAERLSVACEVALGTGDCLLKPYTDGKEIGIDIIPNYNFKVVKSIGNNIKACVIFCDKFIDNNNNEFVRTETQQMSKRNGIDTVIIKNQAWKNGNKIPIESVPSWAHIKELPEIPSTRLLFGRIKCPTVNRENVNSANGVSITYGLDSVLENAKTSYNRLNDELEKKEAWLFTDKTLLTKDKNGNPILPKGSKKTVRLIQGIDNDKKIFDYSPQIRDESFTRGIEQNFKMLELLSGLSSGVVTEPTTNYATATEMKANLQMTYAFITKFRHFVMIGVDGLSNAIDVIANINNLTPIGKFDLKWDWSASYIENLTEQYSRMITAEAIGAVDKSEVRAWLMDIPKEQAKEEIKEFGVADENIE